MREIKFRVWCKIQKKMYRHEEIDMWDRLMKGDMSNQFSPLMQYTNLKDKNGQEICEGDIVKTFWGDVAVVKNGEFQCSDILDVSEDFYNDQWGERKDYGFYVEHIEDKVCCRLDTRTDKWIEVVGNIYENPKILRCVEKENNKRR